MKILKICINFDIILKKVKNELILKNLCLIAIGNDRKNLTYSCMHFLFTYGCFACRENSRVLDLSYVRTFFGTVTKTKENEYSMRENSRKFYFVMGE